MWSYWMKLVLCIILFLSGARVSDAQNTTQARWLSKLLLTDKRELSYYRTCYRATTMVGSAVASARRSQRLNIGSPFCARGGFHAWSDIYTMVLYNESSPTKHFYYLRRNRHIPDFPPRYSSPWAAWVVWRTLGPGRSRTTLSNKSFKLTDILPVTFPKTSCNWRQFGVSGSPTSFSVGAIRYICTRSDCMCIGDARYASSAPGTWLYVVGKTTGEETNSDQLTKEDAAVAAANELIAPFCTRPPQSTPMDRSNTPAGGPLVLARPTPFIPNWSNPTTGWRFAWYPPNTAPTLPGLPPDAPDMINTIPTDAVTQTMVMAAESALHSFKNSPSK